MAERRMFARTIVTSDAFLDMSPSARCLYFTLAMFADDDGFVNNPKSIMRQSGATTDDMNILIAKKFVIVFESGVLVIKHWRIHNYIQNDRKHDTKYQEEMSRLLLDENKAYKLMDTEWIQDVSKTDTEVRLGKDRDKDRLDMNIKDVRPSDEGQGTSSDIKSVVSAWNELPVTKVQAINQGTKRYKMLKARLSEYGIDAVLEAINLVSQSPFLLGRKTDFVITFDWFVRPNNFIKVYEGNYNEQFRRTKHDALEDFMEGGNNDKEGIW